MKISKKVTGVKHIEQKYIFTYEEGTSGVNTNRLSIEIPPFTMLDFRRLLKVR